MFTNTFHKYKDLLDFVAPLNKTISCFSDNYISTSNSDGNVQEEVDLKLNYNVRLTLIVLFLFVYLCFNLIQIESCFHSPWQEYKKQLKMFVAD